MANVKSIEDVERKMNTRASVIRSLRERSDKLRARIRTLDGEASELEREAHHLSELVALARERGAVGWTEANGLVSRWILPDGSRTDAKTEAVE